MRASRSFEKAVHPKSAVVDPRPHLAHEVADRPADAPAHPGRAGVGRRARSSAVVRCGYAVAGPALAEDVPGTGCIVAQLAAELLHEGADRAGGAPAPRAPHPVQEVVVARDLAGVDRQGAQQIVLGGGHAAFRVVNEELPGPVGPGASSRPGRIRTAR